MPSLRSTRSSRRHLEEEFLLESCQVMSPDLPLKAGKAMKRRTHTASLESMESMGKAVNTNMAMSPSLSTTTSVCTQASKKNNNNKVRTPLASLSNQNNKGSTAHNIEKSKAYAGPAKDLVGLDKSIKDLLKEAMEDESPLTPPTRVTMGVYRDRQPQLDDDDDDEDAQEVQEQKENWEWHDAEEDYETDYDVDESRLLCGALASLNLSSACSESGQMLRGLPVPAGKHTRFED